MWQWLHHHAKTYDGRTIDKTWYKQLLIEEIQKIKYLVGTDAFEDGQFVNAIALFDKLVTQAKFESFLTLGAYDVLCSKEFS